MHCTDKVKNSSQWQSAPVDQTYGSDFWSWEIFKLETSGDWTVISSEHVLLMFRHFFKQIETSYKTHWKNTWGVKGLAYVWILSDHYHKNLWLLMKTDNQNTEYYKSKKSVKKKFHCLDALVLVGFLGVCLFVFNLTNMFV